MEHHGFGVPLVSVVLITEGYLVVFHGQQAMVTDGDAVGVATEVGDDLFGTGKGVFGVDHPGLGVELVEQDGEAGRRLERHRAAGKMEAAGLVVLAQAADEFPSEDCGQCSDWEQEDLVRVGILLTGNPALTIR